MNEKTNHLVWHPSQVDSAHRCTLLRQHPVTLWMTGLSGAGKSTLAFALEKQLLDLGHACFVLDGDNIRHGLNQDLGFSPEDRAENIRRVAEVAKLLNAAGLIVIASFISPYREDRAYARHVIGDDAFREIYIATSLTNCEARDVKGLYQKARQGLIPDFTGVSAPFEQPIDPALVIDTGDVPVQESVKQLLNLLKNNLTS
jgi:adenylyl-sulfate kinase